MKILTVLVLLFLPGITIGQIITTFAGTGAPSISGDGGPAIAAGVPHPGGGVFDKHGNYYFCETNNAYRVCKINPSGIISTVAGNSALGGYNGDNIQATAAKLNFPNSVTVDSLGNLFIADVNNHRVRKVDATTGIITTIAGTGMPGFSDGIPATAAQLYGPQDMRFDKHGNLYIADLGNNKIRKINTDGIISTYAGSGVGAFCGEGVPATDACLTAWGVCIDDTGNVYISDRSNCRVRKVDTFGIIHTIAGTGFYPYSSDDIPALTSNIDPVFVAIWNKELFLTDQRNNRIRRIDLSGIIHTIAGIGTSGYSGDGGSATTAKLANPAGITFDTCGNIYIADNDSNHIRRIIVDTPCYTNDPTLTTNIVKKITAPSIYPNPTNEELHINNITTQATYAIQSIVGAVMQQGMLHNGSNTIPVATLPPGMYLLQVSNGGEKTVRKIIKR